MGKEEDRINELEDDRIGNINENVQRILKIIEGNGSDGLVIKVERNTLRVRMFCWAIGVLYVGFTGALFAFIFKLI